VTLDPDIAAVIDALNTGFPPVHTMTGAQARAAIRGRLRSPAAPEPVGDVAEETVPGGDIPVRIYRPRSPATAVVVFAHGGGFVFCDLDTHDAGWAPLSFQWTTGSHPNIGGPPRPMTSTPLSAGRAGSAAHSWWPVTVREGTWQR